MASIPDEEEFPYVIRVVSDTLESNGSSSMGSVCASSMALQAAGVPVSAPVAGVAMGLIKEGDDHVVLTDIAGVEDHLGDMDFKVAGFEGGITALQMDIKISGVTFEILRDALEQARQGRLFILGKMAEAIEGPREELSEYAPAIETIQIDPEKIGAVIGKGGETIRGMQEEFEAEIDIDDDGTVRVYAPSGKLVKDCIERIEAMTREAEVGDTFKGKVVKTTTFGAFVELVKGTDGLLHISNVKPGERVGTVEDVLSAGDELDVTVVEVDRERGRIGLRLSDDPSIEGKSADELAGVGTGDPGPRRGGDGGGGRGRERLDGGGRGGRERRGGARPPVTACPRTSSSRELDGLRVITEVVPSVRSVALGLWVRTGSRDEGPGQEGLSHFLEHLLFKGTERHSAIEISELFDGMGAAANAATSKESTHLHARFLDEHTAERLRPDVRDAAGAGAAGRRDRSRARGRARGDRDVRGRAPGPGARRAGRGRLRRAPARPAGSRARRPSSPGSPATRSPPTTPGATRPRTSSSRSRPRRARRDRGAGAPSPEPATRERRTGASASAVAPEPRLRFHAKETEQYHICFGGRGIRARRRSPLRARRARLRCSGARPPPACFARSARSAASRTRSAPTPSSTSTRAWSPCTSAPARRT